MAMARGSTTWDHLGPRVLEPESSGPEHVPAGRQDRLPGAVLEQTQPGGGHQPHLRLCSGAPRAANLLPLANSRSGRSDSPARAGSAAKDERPGETRITAERARSGRPSAPVAKTCARVPVLPPSMMTEKRAGAGARRRGGVTAWTSAETRRARSAVPRQRPQSLRRRRGRGEGGFVVGSGMVVSGQDPRPPPAVIPRRRER